MVYRYRLITTHLPAAKKSGECYYGLLASEKASGRHIITVPALSTDKAAVSRLKCRLEENGVAPCHVRDVWEDMMPEE